MSRLVQWTGVLLCAACLAYFSLLDHALLSSAHFSPIFRYLLTAYDSRTAWLALTICVIAAFWTRPAPILALVDAIGQHPRAIAWASAALIALGAVFVYRDCPFSMDEYAAVFQSKIFASGHLYAALPPELVDWLVVRGFNGSFLIASPETGKAVEYYWPGFSLLLAPFEFLGVPWLCNACLAGLGLILIHRITLEITGDRRAAGWSLLFAVASGAFAGNAQSYYSMQAHLTANLLFVALLLKPTAFRGFGAGLVGSIALILHNPVPHALFAVPWIVGIAADREQRRYLLPLILGYVPGVGVGLGWLIFRADVASAPFAASVGGLTSGVFAWPDSAILNMRAAALVKVWLWAVPCLFVFALLGGLRYRDNRHVRLLLQSAIVTFVGYLFVRFDQGHGWGYRYFHPAWGVIPILAGCAMAASSASERRLVCFAGAAAILNLVVVVPFQLIEISQVISQHLAQIPQAKRPGNNVYFVHPRGGFYVADLVQIDPLLRNQDLLLVSHGADEDTRLIRRNWPSAVKIFSGRAVDQWYLGPRDQRFSLPGEKSGWHFVFGGRR